MAIKKIEDLGKWADEIKKDIIATKKRAMDQRELRKMGTQVVKAMKEMIAQGTSPIAGQTKFPRYKNPQRYPGNRKPHSPVNLKLKGQFLRSLTSKVTGGPVTTLWIQFTNDLAAKKESGHREGVHGQPKRPIIPAENEELKKQLRSVLTKGLRAVFGKHWKLIVKDDG